MSEEGSFHTYSPKKSGLRQAKAHVLFHSRTSSWMLANDATLEMALCLCRGESVDEVTAQWVARYGISAERARDDVVHVAEHLAGAGFLRAGSPELAGPMKHVGPSPRTPRLDALFFHLTGRCNLRCPHCYVSENSNDFPTPLVLRLIDEFVEQGGRGVNLSGGEPLLHPDIKKIVNHAAPKVKIRLLTNGTLIDRKWAAFLADADVFVQLSIDGSKREVHDAIRGSGSFEKTLKGLGYLMEVGLGEKVNFSTTIMRQNFHDLSEIVKLADEIGVQRTRFLPLSRLGKAFKNWEAIKVDHQDQQGFHQYILELQRNRGCSVEVSCGLSGFLLKVPNECSDDDMWCAVGRQLIIGLDGDVFPCILLMRKDFKLGNVFDAGLKEIIHTEQMVRLCRVLPERRAQIEKCAACTWRNLCQAACMGQALAHKGTLWDTDEFCDYRQKAYEAAFDLLVEDFTARW